MKRGIRNFVLKDDRGIRCKCFPANAASSSSSSSSSRSAFVPLYRALILSQIKIFQLCARESIVAVRTRDPVRNEHVDRTFANVLTFASSRSTNNLPRMTTDALTSTGQAPRSRRYRWCWQLRQFVRSGPYVLSKRQIKRAGPRPHERRCRRLSCERHSDILGLRRERKQSGSRRRRSDLGQPEQHPPLYQRCPDRRCRASRPRARRDRPLSGGRRSDRAE